MMWHSEGLFNATDIFEGSWHQVKQVSSTFPFITVISRPPLLELLSTPDKLWPLNSLLLYFSNIHTCFEIVLPSPSPKPWSESHHPYLAEDVPHPAAQPVFWRNAALNVQPLSWQFFRLCILCLTPSSRCHTKVFHCLDYMFLFSIHLISSHSYLDTNLVKETCLAGLPRLGQASLL